MAMALPSTTRPARHAPTGTPVSQARRRPAAGGRAACRQSSAPPATEPSPNTSVRMLRSLGRLNSSPITNIRNTTPNSARYARRRVLGQRQRVGADQHAHHQVAQHGRQLQRAAGHHAQHGGHQVQQDEFEGGGHPASGQHRPAGTRGLLECPILRRVDHCRCRPSHPCARHPPFDADAPCAGGTHLRDRGAALQGLAARQGEASPRRAGHAGLPRPRGGDGHGQERPCGPQDRRHPGLHRHAGVLRAPGRGQPRRPGHGHRRRRGAGHQPTAARATSWPPSCRRSPPGRHAGGDDGQARVHAGPPCRLVLSARSTRRPAR
jgi:hypothetical protein